MHHPRELGEPEFFGEFTLPRLRRLVRVPQRLRDLRLVRSRGGESLDSLSLRRLERRDRLVQSPDVLLEFLDLAL